MTYELRVERMLDAPPEMVFDTFVDPDATEELFTSPELSGLRVVESSLDLRVGGTWTIVQEDADGERYRLTYVFTEIDRPHRLVASFSMHFSRSGRTDKSEVSLTLEDRNGKTLLTLVQDGFETEEERDAYLSGAPGFLDAVERAVSSRVAQ
jgi:uncharacterized protein YndB with AHSA1/START domain